MAANAPPAAVNDPLLRAGVLQRVNVLGGKTVDAAQLAPGEWERLRTAIAIKTFGALVKRYYVRDSALAGPALAVPAL